MSAITSGEQREKTRGRRPVRWQWGTGQWEACALAEALRTDITGRARAGGLGCQPLSLTASSASIPVMLAWVLLPAQPLTHCAAAGRSTLSLWTSVSSLK